MHSASETLRTPTLIDDELLEATKRVHLVLIARPPGVFLPQGGGMFTQYSPRCVDACNIEVEDPKAQAAFASYGH